MVKTIEKDHPDKSSSTIVNKSQVKNDIYDFAMNHAKKLKKRKLTKLTIIKIQLLKMIL